MKKAVFESICNDLEDILETEDIRKLPKTYELIGDILIIYISDELFQWKREIGNAYLKNFKRVKTVLRKGYISGEYRKPNFEYLAGNGTDTMHIENKIKFKLDLSPYGLPFSRLCYCDRKESSGFLLSEREYKVE
jgi:tRNA G37 N-methylase Trm5